MSFADEIYELSDYLMMPFVLTDRKKSFQELLPGFNNPHFYIHSKDKALYHALCVLGGNLSTYLWQKTLKGFEALGLPPQIAHPYMLRLCQNLLSHPENALTGPLARKDLKTVIKNDQALAKTNSQKIYRSFVETIYPEAMSQLGKEGRL
jgi:2-dehydropantoate 2-reductase